VIQSNALHIPLKDESVQCVITSPPYWGLRDYGTATWEGGKDGCDHIKPDRQGTNGERANRTTGHDDFYAESCDKCGAKRIDNQLGLEATPELYIENTITWAREVWRVLRKDGTFWLNLGDSYNAHSRGEGNGGINSKRNLPEYRKGEGLGKCKNLKPKDLIGIPWKVVFALQADGWWLRSAMPWVKRSSMPESCTDRPASALEYMFLLTKSGTSQYWTHRDFSGVREIPKPDWRWQHQAEELELDEPPDGWVDSLIACPVCDGTGYENRFANTDLFGETQMTWGSICESCKDTDYIIGDLRFIKEWKRINLWQGHDYYFDMEAIRKGVTGNAHAGRKDEELSPRYGANDMDGHNQRNGTWKQSYLPSSRNFRNTDLFYQSLEAPHGAIFCGDEMVGLDVNPQAYSEAHFATFPEWLVTPLIKAGTSEKGACPECGAPWERVVEKSGGTIGKSWHSHENDIGLGQRTEGEMQKKIGDGTYQIKTIGWEPSCKCGHKETVPCIVLDIFGGSGTTKNVADRLGRKGVICELKMEYIEMARKRCYLAPDLF